jgi:nucleotide-binding universal stress UspA family protein
MSMNVLIATDGSDHAMKAVMRGVELAQKEGAKVTLMSVAYYAMDEFDELVPDIQNKLEAHAQEALEKAKAVFVEKGIPVETILEAGLVPANNIIRRAEADRYDQILMGSTGVSGFMRALIGSTASKVVAQAPCCVTVIR